MAARRYYGCAFRPTVPRFLPRRRSVTINPLRPIEMRRMNHSLHRMRRANSQGKARECIVPVQEHAAIYDTPFRNIQHYRKSRHVREIRMAEVPHEQSTPFPRDVAFGQLGALRQHICRRLQNAEARPVLSADLTLNSPAPLDLPSRERVLVSDPSASWT